MRKELFTYLKLYSSEPRRVNRMIVSNFLYSNNIKKCRNQLLEQNRINENDSDFEDFQNLIKSHSITTVEDLIQVFEFVISPEEKVVTGAIYTPNYIREYIVDHTIPSNALIDESFKVCDPACGCSGFLFSAAKRIKKISGRSYSQIFRENLYGLDIQQYSLIRSELFLTLAAIVNGEDEEKFTFNLYSGNALNFDWNQYVNDFIGFDAVVGNPPYVCSRNIEGESKDLIHNWTVSKSGHPDLYIPFFELGVTFLKPDGILGFISMNTFFKSVNGRALREYFQSEKLSMKIIDFGAFQVFQSKSTYTCICIIKKSSAEEMEYVRISDSNSLFSNSLSFEKVGYKGLNFSKGWNLQEIEILSKIERTGTPLGKKFVSRNGIATLKNDVYIFDPIEENEKFYTLNNGGHYKIERKACVDVINPNKLTKLDSIESLRKKIIFPYHIKNGQPKIIPEIEFKKSFPNAYNYLLAKKDMLSQRDKGKGENYDVWYSYGRNQSLEPYDYKLFFPHIAQTSPNFVINKEPSLLFVNGLAIIGENEWELKYLKKVMSSRLFWFYIVNSSKPYGSGYYSFSRNYIKNFGVYNFSKDQIKHLISLTTQKSIDKYLESLYEINLDSLDFNLLPQPKKNPVNAKEEVLKI